MDLMRNAMYLQQSRRAQQDDDPVMDMVGKAAVGLGLIGKVQDMSDQIAVRNRTEQLSNLLRENGGDFSALPDDVIKGRVGMQAMANVTKAWQETEAGKQKIFEVGQQNARYQYNNLMGGLKAVEDARAAGDIDLASKAMEETTRRAGLPYEVKHEGNGIFRRYHVTPEGNQDMGTATLDELTKTGRSWLADSKAFVRGAIAHNIALQDTNLAIASSPDKWMVSKKDGKDRTLMPFYNYQPGSALTIGYIDADSGERFTDQDALRAGGYSAPESKSGDLKEKAAQLKQSQVEQSAKIAEQKAALGWAGVQNARDKLALEQEKAEFAKSTSGQKVGEQVFLNELKAQGLEYKNGAFLDVEGNRIDPRDARVAQAKANAVQAQNGVLGALGLPGIRQPEARPSNPAIDFYLSRRNGS